MPKNHSKPQKHVFVIMPFTKTPMRNKRQLKSFFNVQIKKAIENATDLKYRYKVELSEDAFDITAQLFRDLYSADIVIADRLSRQDG